MCLAGLGQRMRCFFEVWDDAFGGFTAGDDVFGSFGSLDDAFGIEDDGFVGLGDMFGGLWSQE